MLFIETVTESSGPTVPRAGLPAAWAALSGRLRAAAATAAAGRGPADWDEELLDRPPVYSDYLDHHVTVATAAAAGPREAAAAQCRGTRTVQM